MTSNEVKVHPPRQPDGASLPVAGDATSAEQQLMNQNLVQNSDRWAKQLPRRLIASVLSYVGALEAARSQAVCQGWKLAPNFLERLWRNRYEADWEIETGESKGIAVAGKET